MKHYVYTLAYPDGKVFYVGKGIRGRINDHEREASKGFKSHKCSAIRKIWANGGKVVKAKLAYFDTHEEALQYELSLIFFINAEGKLTNLTDGGEGTPGHVNIEHLHKIHAIRKGQKFTEETRRKMSEAQLGRKHTLETRHKMSQINKGRKLTPDHIEKVANGHRGRKNTEETKQRMSESAKKRPPRSEEHRRNLGKAAIGRVPWNKGKKLAPLSEEHRRKQSEALKGRALPAEQKAKMSESQKQRWQRRRIVA